LPSAAPAKPSGRQKAGPVRLAFRKLTVEIDVRRLFVREVDIANWQTTASIEGDHVGVKPLKLALNGAPVDASLELNLHPTGVKYAFSLDAKGVPLTPMLDSVGPQFKGALSGTLSALASVQGGGMTGTELKRSLGARFDVATTNLNFSLESLPADTVSMRLLKTLMNAIALIPDLTRDLSGASASPVELAKSPINAIALHGTAGSGKIELAQALVQGPAFEAIARGTVTLDDVLTNSAVQIPVSIYLERGVAQALKIPVHGAPDGPYVKVPDFLTIKGTLGKPKARIDRAALTGAMLADPGPEWALAF